MIILDSNKYYNLGSVSMTSDLNGTVSQYIEYIPFGEEMFSAHRNTYNSPYRYSAKELDEETGLYYYGARYYNPKLSIWLSVDPMVEKYISLSPYNYMMNNPVNMIDPDGREIKGFSINSEGKVVIGEKASKDAIRIYNAMVKTEMGENAFKKLINSNTKIKLKLTNSKLDGGQGETTSKGYDEETGEYDKATIKISTNMDDTRFDIAKTVDEVINVVGVHETLHAVDNEQIKVDRNLRKRDPEAKMTWEQEEKALRTEYAAWLQYREKFGIDTEEVIKLYESKGTVEDYDGKVKPPLKPIEDEEN